MIVVYEVPIMFIVFIVGAILGLNLVDVCFWISWVVGVPTILFSIVMLKTIKEDYWEDDIGWVILSIITIIFFTAMIIIFTILFNNKVYFNGLDLLEWFFSL